MPSSPAIEDTLTMQPRAGLQVRAQARTIWKLPTVLTA